MTVHPDSLADRFTACTLPKNQWTHEAHLVVGLWHVDRYGPDEALRRLRTGIRRLNDSHGTPNSLTRGYHETITRAYVTLLASFFETCPPAMSLQQRAELLLSSPLAEKSALLRFYSQERLMSTDARTAWVEPDLIPLQVTTPAETA